MKRKWNRDLTDDILIYTYTSSVDLLYCGITYGYFACTSYIQVQYANSNLSSTWLLGSWFGTWTERCDKGFQVPEFIRLKILFQLKDIKITYDSRPFCLLGSRIISNSNFWQWRLTPKKWIFFSCAHWLLPLSRVYNLPSSVDLKLQGIDTTFRI
jgi:hypothetical protein